MALSYEKLSESELATGLASLDGWSVQDGMLAKEFTFEAYSRSVLFLNAVAFLAESLNHHPDVLLGYGKVRVATVTHDAGGITSYDIELARRVQALV